MRVPVFFMLKNTTLLNKDSDCTCGGKREVTKKKKTQETRGHTIDLFCEFHDAHSCRPCILRQRAHSACTCHAPSEYRGEEDGRIWSIYI